MTDQDLFIQSVSQAQIDKNKKLYAHLVEPRFMQVNSGANLKKE